MRSSADLSTKARIRDAAIETFARHGFRATTIRAVASAADVSAALVIHHFGSKEHLIETCDDYVSTVLSDEIAELERKPSGEQVLEIWQRAAEFRHLVSYIVTAVQENTPFARTYLATAIDLTEKYLRHAVSLGLVRPARDERRRAELVVLLKLGMFALGGLFLPPDTDPAAVPDLITDRFTDEALDLFTEPTFLATEYLHPLRNAATASATTKSRRTT